MWNYLGADLLLVVQSVGVGEPVNTLFMLRGESLHIVTVNTIIHICWCCWFGSNFPESTKVDKDLLTGLVLLSMLTTSLR